MPNPWIDRSETQARLAKFFSDNKGDLNKFGSTVNQTFEAFVFASVIEWYRNHGWSVDVRNPRSDPDYVKLKFSTRGRPSLYTHALCAKGDQKVQVRHGLRVATKHHRKKHSYAANVVLDVAVISDTDLAEYRSEDHVDNSRLVTFGEAKHMSAFAELIAAFIGLVHELAPDRLKRLRLRKVVASTVAHPPPFLYVSGYLYPTAQGIVETIKSRGYDIDVYDYSSGAGMFGIKLPVTFKRKTKKLVVSA